MPNHKTLLFKRTAQIARNFGVEKSIGLQYVVRKRRNFSSIPYRPIVEYIFSNTCFGGLEKHGMYSDCHPPMPRRTTYRAKPRSYAYKKPKYAARPAYTKRPARKYINKLGIKD